MRHLTVGAGRSWDVLSGGDLAGVHAAPRTVEWVLEELHRHESTSPESRRLAAHVLPQISFLRAAVERGDDGSAERVEELRSCVLMLAADTSCERRLRRALLDFLPAHRRPAVDDLADLDRAWGLDGPLITLFVRWQARTPGVIMLGDIVTSEGLRGHGLGGETLRELCDFADRSRARIEAKFIPDPAEARTAIAQWYARAGFARGAMPPDQWSIGALITRAPGADSRNR